MIKTWYSWTHTWYSWSQPLLHHGPYTPLPYTITYTDCICWVTVYNNHTGSEKNIHICIHPILNCIKFSLFYYSAPYFQEHVGEYGVHWNFFFTLAAVSILTQLTPIPPSQSGWAGGIILIGQPSIPPHQFGCIRGVCDYQGSGFRVWVCKLLCVDFTYTRVCKEYMIWMWIWALLY